MSGAPGPEARLHPEGLRARAVVLRALRSWFHAHGYLEVPTPVLVPSPALEANLYGVPAADRWLRTSPEMALKRVIAAGLPRIYEIGPCFRAEERGAWHGREFLLCEWYRAGANLPNLMDEVESLVGACADALGAPVPRWRRTTVAALFQEHVGVDVHRATARAIHPEATDDRDQAFFHRWVDTIEPALHEGVLVSDWPASQAALARVRTHAGVPVACRFEAYLNGLELANAFEELADGPQIRARFAASAEARAARGQPPHPVDEAFLAALDHLPPCSGIALGVERLVAALLGWSGLRQGRADHPGDPGAPT